MKRLFLVFLFLALSIKPCLAEVNFVFDFQPASLLISSDVDGFSVYDSSYYYYESETIDGSGSWLPTLTAGIGIDTQVVRFDLKAGGGYLWNNAFSSPVLMADAAMNFKLGRAVTLGPHIGLINFSDPTWDGSADLIIDDTTGVMAGIDFSVGSKISFLLSLDYLSAEMDVRPAIGSGWIANDDTIDLSGVALRMGIVGNF